MEENKEEQEEEYYEMIEQKSFQMEQIIETQDEQTTTLSEPSFKSEDVDLVFKDFGQVVEEEQQLESLAKPKVKFENSDPEYE